MLYSDDTIEEVRSRNDIVEVISGYVRLQKKGSSYFGLCPFHNEKSPSFSVSPGKQMYYCFGCGAGGNVFTFIMEYENYSFPEAVKFLADRAGMSLPEPEYSEEARQQADLRQTILELNKQAAAYYYYQLHRDKDGQAYGYLKGRALADETIKKFGLGYASRFSNHLYTYLKGKGYKDEMLMQSGLFGADEKNGVYDKFWNRVMFPIMDVNGRVIGFGGRVMGDGKPKYLNSPETKIFDKSRNLYGLNIARTSRKPNLIICEGYMDVIALHQAGFTNAVASLGTALTIQQANLMKRYVKEVLLAYDSDNAGVKAALRGIQILKSAGLSVKVIDMRPYKDPDEFIQNMGAEAYEERIAAAENSFMYELKIMEADYDMKDPESKTGFQNAVAKKLSEFKEELERNNYIEAVASKYHMGFDNLRRLVHHYGIQSDLGKVSEKPKSGLQRRNRKEDGMRTSQKLLVTWMIESPSYLREIRKVIEPEDFTIPLYQRVVRLLYEQSDAGEMNPAQIINYFSDEEEHKEVAGLFNTRLEELKTQEEREKALKETIVRVKENSYEVHSANLDATDISGLQRLVEAKKALDNLEKLHISID